MSRVANVDARVRVIGAGFGRTGTLSLKLALERLGFGPCYHMEEVIRHPAHVRAWLAATRGEPVDWRALFSGWGSTVDWPGCAFYGPLAEAFPDAKVVLSVRDPVRWHRSVLDTIRRPTTMFPLRLLLPLAPGIGPATRMATELIWTRTFHDRVEDQDHALGVFHAHVAAVTRDVDASRLLVFDVRDGWPPLCAFLGVPVPSEPFPHVNDTASVRRALLVLNTLAWAVFTAPAWVPVAIWWALG